MLKHLEKRDTRHMIVLELLKTAFIIGNNFVYSHIMFLLRQIVAYKTSIKTSIKLVL